MAVIAIPTGTCYKNCPSRTIFFSSRVLHRRPDYGVPRGSSTNSGFTRRWRHQNQQQRPKKHKFIKTHLLKAAPQYKHKQMKSLIWRGKSEKSREKKVKQLMQLSTYIRMCTSYTSIKQRCIKPCKTGEWQLWNGGSISPIWLTGGTPSFDFSYF